MSKPDSNDPTQRSMLELFRGEVENQANSLSDGLLSLERGSRGPEQLEMLMRAAHSIKGAARIVNVRAVERLAHVMEDCFTQAQDRKLTLGQPEIDLLFRAVDLLQQIARQGEADIAPWEVEHAADMDDALSSLAHLAQTGSLARRPPPEEQALPVPVEARGKRVPERVVRLATANLNRLLGLAGESLVESRWLRPFADSLQRLRRQQTELGRTLDDLRQVLREEPGTARGEHQLEELARSVASCQQLLAERMQELDLFERRSALLSQRMYLEVLRARMRPFSDCASRFPRMVRDLARALGKKVRLEVTGEDTQVDRDVMERLEAPLAHLLRNAVDHGCEPPEQRRLAGKPPEGIIRLEARHSAGMLLVTVADDGPGVPLERVRQIVLQRKLAPTEVVEKLAESELLDYLFRPGFTLKESVTEISGRGVGLDVVQNMVRNVRGNLRVITQPGRGLRVQLQMPITLSVVRALLVEVDGEPYAFPLNHISRALRLSRERVEKLENRYHFPLAGHQVGLVAAQQVFDTGAARPFGSDLPVVVLGERNVRYGVVVDRFLGERELVVQPLDSRLGKIKDISAAAMMEDGSPVLIVDVDDMLQSIEKLVAERPLVELPRPGLELPEQKAKRVLVVDDSLTVRELVRKILTTHGYLIDTAVDGTDGWNAVRSGDYDLIITDVDMPHLDGIGLIALIKRDPRLKSLPIMVVSYKESEEDRLRGMDAGADYYFPKGDFNDALLLQAVVDLVGEPGT
ncbi:MAG TPA: hybrid sensor histidine kinase/response regulator [Candidatus Paceibacterota bacterium]|nr:hybrid sensor histidine kinase/response regulator [Verrucomicrobiota bacterium]HSA11170.1 hybrid sensor histidine kinase/response regulator [Candidatus Paceibacterota bacterium]